jgi:hypothetical protein
LERGWREGYSKPITSLIYEVNEAVLSSYPHHFDALPEEGDLLRDVEGRDTYPTSLDMVTSLDPKQRPNHRIYIQTLRNMSPEQRLLKAFELSEFAKQLFAEGLRKRHPDLSDDDFKALLRKHLDKCHNRNY